MGGPTGPNGPLEELRPGESNHKNEIRNSPSARCAGGRFGGPGGGRGTGTDVETVKRCAVEVILNHARQIGGAINTNTYCGWGRPPTMQKRIKSLIVEATDRLRKHNDWVLQQFDAAKQTTGGKPIFWIGSAEDWTR